MKNVVPDQRVLLEANWKYFSSFYKDFIAY